MAPVAGSTNTILMRPPRRMLPKYHPLISAETVPLPASYPASLTATLYLAAEKYPVEPGSVIVMGVVPCCISFPNLSVMTISAPDGLLLNVIGQFDLLT